METPVTSAFVNITSLCSYHLLVTLRPILNIDDIAPYIYSVS